MNAEEIFSGQPLAVAQAIIKNERSEIRRLTHSGVDPNTIGRVSGKPGPSLLAFALTEQKKDAVVALLQAGADPNLPLNVLKGASVMVLAVRIKNPEFIEILLDNGGNPNSKNAGGESLIQIAALNEHWTIVDLLITRGADINSTQTDGETVLHQVTGRRDFEHAFSLLNRGADALLRSVSGASSARDIFHLSVNAQRFPKEAEWQEKCRRLLESQGIKDPGPADEFNPRPIPEWK